MSLPWWAAAVTPARFRAVAAHVGAVTKDKGPRDSRAVWLVRHPDVLARDVGPCRRKIPMTQHKDRKAAIRGRLATTGEPYAEAARQLKRQPDGAANPYGYDPATDMLRVSRHDLARLLLQFRTELERDRTRAWSHMAGYDISFERLADAVEHARAHLPSGLRTGGSQNSDDRRSGLGKPRLARISPGTSQRLAWASGWSARTRAPSSRVGERGARNCAPPRCGSPDLPRVYLRWTWHVPGERSRRNSGAVREAPRPIEVSRHTPEPVGLGRTPAGALSAASVLARVRRHGSSMIAKASATLACRTSSGLVSRSVGFRRRRRLVAGRSPQILVTQDEG